MGDSVRIRVIPSNEWIHGHLMSLDSSRIVVGSLDSLKSWTLDSVLRLEKWERTNSRELLTAYTLCGAIGFGVCAATRCGGYPPLTGSVGGAIGVGAAFGFFMGFLGLQIVPGQWRLVHLPGRYPPPEQVPPAQPPDTQEASRSIRPRGLVPIGTAGFEPATP